MKKPTAFAAAVVIILSLLSYSASAYEIPEYEELLPENALNILSENDIDIEENIGIEKLLSVFYGLFLKLINPTLTMFATLFSCILLTAVFSKIGDIDDEGGIGRMFTYIEMLAVGMILYRMLFNMWQEAKGTLDSLNTLMNAMTVCCSTVYALGGNAASLAVNAPQTMIVISIIADIGNYGILPVLKSLFGLSFISCISSSIKLGSLEDFLRKGFTTLLVALMTILSAVMSFQSILTRSADSMAMRTVKLISGHFIPIVGGFVSEAMSTVSCGMSLLKSTIGLAGITALIIMIASPVISLLLKRTALSLCSVVCDVLGQGTSSKLISGVEGLLNMLIAFMCCVGITFITNLIIFAKSVSEYGN